MHEIDSRITVHEGRQTVELDLSGLYFRTSRDVNALFDRIEDRLQETGEPLWFFLDNVTDYRVDESAWFAFTRRGNDLHQAHSMGTLRYDTAPETAVRIARDRGTDRERPNLFADRAAALAHLSTLPSKRRERIHHHPNQERGRFLRRLSFDAASRRFDINLSGISFEYSRDANDIHEWLEQALRRAGGGGIFSSFTRTPASSPRPGSSSPRAART